MIGLNKGSLFLITGLSGSGKSTLGRMLVDHLNQFGTRSAYLIDGDFSRAFYGNSFSYDAKSRSEMTKRMAFGAKTLTENNVDVILANISGQSSTRGFLRKKFNDMVEVYCKGDIDTLEKYDIKGVYKKAREEDRPSFVGIDLPYEEPESPDVTVYPYSETPEQSLAKIIDCLSGRGPIMGTKADTLESLQKYIRTGRVLHQVVTTWNEFKSDPNGIMDTVQKQLGKHLLAVRSSCRMEDTKLSSNAGAFHTCLNVPLEKVSLMRAVKLVKDSYIEKSVPDAENEQILIQEMLSNVKTSGVICSRYELADSPYITINYDDTGKTDLVTSGAGGEEVFISRFAAKDHCGRWINEIKVLVELEKLFPKRPLEIEFAESDGVVVVLQCRALNVKNEGVSLEESANELIEELKLRFERTQMSPTYIPGSNTVLSDMADWNPSEMIGDRPSTLAYSIYRELITDRTWHEARTSQGYFDVVHANLMLSMARKPYIDTRVSFASFTPADIPMQVRDTLVDGYLNKLKNNPHLHDKVEFDIAYTCFNLGLEDRMKVDSYLDVKDMKLLLNSLKDLTHNLLTGFPDAVRYDNLRLQRLESIRRQTAEKYSNSGNCWESFQAAYFLLEPIRSMGILPFSRFARLGFIARSILFSLSETDVLSKEQVESFFLGVPTVAGALTNDLNKVRCGQANKAEFFEQYGHLRMSTYDIVSPRYDQMADELLDSGAAGKLNLESNRENTEWHLPSIESQLISKGLKTSPNELFRFAKEVTQGRERAKFIFTKALSDLLEYLAHGGESLGLDRSEMQNVTISTLFRFRNPELGSNAKASQYLRSRIGEKENERSVFDLIRLPSVIASVSDMELINISTGKPNYVTRKKVSGKMVKLSKSTRPSAVDLHNKIVVVENADPGFDWIFGENIAGLITKYGGVASHMAIRCAEFGLPGAIGCGEKLFARIESGEVVILDCGGEIVHVQ